MGMSKFEKHWYEIYKKQCIENNAGEEPCLTNFYTWGYNNNIFTVGKILKERLYEQITQKSAETRRNNELKLFERANRND